MKKLFPLILLFVLSMGACKKATIIANVPNDIFPLAVGNSWSYNDSLIFMVDSVPKETTVTGHTLHITRAGYLDEPVDDHRRMENFRVQFDKDSCSFAVFVRTDAEGLVLSGIEGESGSIQLFKGNYVVKYPFNMGEMLIAEGMMWLDCFEATNSEIGPTNPDSLVLQGANVDITTPAGTFSTLPLGRQWWTPGVGMIKLEYIRRQTNGDTGAEEVWIRRRHLTAYQVE